MYAIQCRYNSVEHGIHDLQKMYSKGFIKTKVMQISAKRRICMFANAS